MTSHRSKTLCLARSPPAYIPGLSWATHHITVCDLLPCPQALSVQLICLPNQPNPQTKPNLSACICSFLLKEASLSADGVKILAVCQHGPYPTCESLKVPPLFPTTFVCLFKGREYVLYHFVFRNQNSSCHRVYIS